MRFVSTKIKRQIYAQVGLMNDIKLKNGFGALPQQTWTVSSRRPELPSAVSATSYLGLLRDCGGPRIRPGFFLAFPTAEDPRGSVLRGAAAVEVVVGAGGVSWLCRTSPSSPFPKAPWAPVMQQLPFLAFLGQIRYCAYAPNQYFLEN